MLPIGNFRGGRLVKYSDLKIGTRLAIAFAVVLFLLCAIALVSWKALAANNGRAEVIVEENNVKIAAANAMRGFLNTEVRSLRNIILYTDADTRRSQKDIVLRRASSTTIPSPDCRHRSRPTRPGS